MKGLNQKPVSLVFLFFHMFSGCDTKSSLSGKGKKSFSDMWTFMDEITSLFKKLSSIATPDKISDDEFELLKSLVVRLFQKRTTQKK